MCKSIDDEFLEIACRHGFKAGTTFLLSVLHNGRYSLANIGDSCAFLLKQSGVISKLTVDQTPERPDEYNRIVKNNGFVFKKDNVWRVDGSIAVSRAIGDYPYKQYLISEPETYSAQVQSNDDLLILSTDGLFQIYSQEQLAQMIQKYRLQGLSLEQVAAKITDECCNCTSKWKVGNQENSSSKRRHFRGTESYCKDNVTLILIDLKKYFSDF